MPWWISENLLSNGNGINTGVETPARIGAPLSGMGRMQLRDLLQREKNTILKKWFDLILETYADDAATLMRKERDPFSNPVGATISRAIEALFQGLREGADAAALLPSLDSIIKIRSVQDFSPSKGVAFVFLLKKSVEESLRGEIEKPGIGQEWLSFQARIDELSLQAFDLYVACREKICEIRINQARTEKEMALRLMEKMTTSKEKRKKDEKN